MQAALEACASPLLSVALSCCAHRGGVGTNKDGVPSVEIRV